MKEKQLQSIQEEPEIVNMPTPQEEEERAQQEEVKSLSLEDTEALQS